MTKLAAPPTFEELRAAIIARHDTMSPVLRRISEFALDHPNEMALDTVATLAGRARVQPSAMVRFAQSLGFAGFSDLQRVFRRHLTADRLSYRERLARSRLTPQGSEIRDVLHEFVAASIHALQHLEQDLDYQRLDRMAVILADARTIYVVAQRRAFPVAAYLTYALNRLDRGAVLLDGLGGMLQEQVRAMARGDALLAVSFKPYAPETVAVAAAARERGAALLAVTDRPLSPFRQLADVCLEVDEAEVLDFRLLAATMCLAQALVVVLGRRLVAASLPVAGMASPA
jgi:DNA-binding MurR/RpiR family transcriptional regulator